MGAQNLPREGDLYRLTSVTYPSPSTTSYAFDAFGNRTSMTVAGNTTTYAYDDNDRITSVTPPSPGSWYYYLADSLGSTMAVVDASGAVQDSYTYDVYGTPSKTGSPANEFDFAGQQTDGTGLQYLRARYYDPATGTFLSRDPLASSPNRRANSLSYGAASPANLTDPSGLDSCSRNLPCIPRCLFFNCPSAGQIVNGFGGALQGLLDQLGKWTNQVRNGLMQLGEYGRRAWNAASAYLTDKLSDPLFRLSVLAALAGIGTDLACGAIPATLGASALLCASFIVSTSTLLAARAHHIAEMRANGEIGPNETSCEVVSDVIGAAGTGFGAFTDLVVGELACDAIGARYD